VGGIIHDQVRKHLQGKAVLGVPLSGELPDWCVRDWVIYPAELLNRHAVIIGGSGTGKTEFLLRLAYLATKILKWQVFYIDAKGDYEVANRFMATMAHAGERGAMMFPDLAYHGWRGDATAILNRLMAIEDYSEPYYRASAKIAPGCAEYFWPYSEHETVKMLTKTTVCRGSLDREWLEHSSHAAHYPFAEKLLEQLKLTGLARGGSRLLLWCTRRS